MDKIALFLLDKLKPFSFCIWFPKLINETRSFSGSNAWIPLAEAPPVLVMLNSNTCDLPLSTLLNKWGGSTKNIGRMGVIRNLTLIRIKVPWSDLMVMTKRPFTGLDAESKISKVIWSFGCNVTLNGNIICALTRSELVKDEVAFRPLRMPNPSFLMVVTL